ncbi:MAG: porin family protein [Prevotella sp.]|nr:porin family protein [Prevotella sp.]
MKKILGTLVMLLCLSVMPADAQGLSFGVKGGTTRSTLKFDKDNFFGKGHYGWFIGPSLKVGLPLGFGVDGAVLYDQREVKIVDEQTMKIKQISIPVNARFNLALAPATGTGLYLAAGPQVAFNVGDSEFKWTSKESYENTFQLKKSTFSINLGAGVYLLKMLELGFAYNIEMGNTGDITWSSLTDKSNYKSSDETKVKTWKLQATIYF